MVIYPAFTFFGDIGASFVNDTFRLVLVESLDISNFFLALLNSGKLLFCVKNFFKNDNFPQQKRSF